MALGQGKFLLFCLECHSRLPLLRWSVDYQVKRELGLDERCCRCQSAMPVQDLLLLLRREADSPERARSLLALTVLSAVVLPFLEMAGMLPCGRGGTVTASDATRH